MRETLKPIVLGIVATLVAFGGALADDDGAKLFKRQCGTCHATEAGKNGVGPSLSGLIGRKAGTVPGFSYSDANKKSGVVWDAVKLDEYLVDPRKFIPGTKMVFTGLKKAEERRSVIDFLKDQR